MAIDYDKLFQESLAESGGQTSSDAIDYETLFKESEAEAAPTKKVTIPEPVKPIEKPKTLTGILSKGLSDFYSDVSTGVKEAPAALAALPGQMYDAFMGKNTTEEVEKAVDAWHMPTSKAQRLGYNVFSEELTGPELIEGFLMDTYTDWITSNTSPDEMADIYVENVQGVTKRKDEKGNVFLKHPNYEQEFAIKPGFRLTDIPGFLVDAIGALGFSTLFKQATKKVMAREGKQAFESAFNQKLKDAATLGIGEGLYETGKQVAQSASGGRFDPLDPLLAATMGFGGELGPRLKVDAQTGAIDSVAESMQPLAKGKRGEGVTSQLIESVGVDPALVKAETGTGFDLPPAALATTQKGKEALRVVEQLTPETFPQERLARNIEIAEKGLEDAGAVYKVDAPDAPGVSEMAKESMGARRDKLKNIAEQKFSQVDKYISKDDDVFMKNTLDFIEETKEGAGTRYTSVIKQIDDAIQRGGYNYTDLINQKSVVGQNMKMKSEAYRNMKDADITALYNAITQDQADNIIDIAKRQPGMNEKEALKISRINEQAKKATKKYIDVQKSIDDYFEGTQNITTKVSRVLNTAKTSPGEKLGELINILPKSNRSQVLMTAFADSVTGKGGVDFQKWSTVYKSIADNPKMFTEFNKNIGPSAKKFFRDMYSLSKALSYEAKSAKLTETQKKSLINAMSPKSLIERSVSSIFTKIGLAQIVDMMLPNAGFAAVGLTHDIVSKGQTKRLEALGSFISSPEFKSLMRGYATNRLGPNAINNTANSKAFRDFWKETKQRGGEVAKKAFLRSIIPNEQEQEQE
jgi:hypothetical protein